MKVTYVTLTALTIAMIKMRPSLKASYDNSLVRTRRLRRLLQWWSLYSAGWVLPVARYGACEIDVFPL